MGRWLRQATTQHLGRASDVLAPVGAQGNEKGMFPSVPMFPSRLSTRSSGQPSVDSQSITISYKSPVRRLPEDPAPHPPNDPPRGPSTSEPATRRKSLVCRNPPLARYMQPSPKSFWAVPPRSRALLTQGAMSAVCGEETGRINEVAHLFLSLAFGGLGLALPTEISAPSVSPSKISSSTV